MVRQQEARLVNEYLQDRFMTGLKWVRQRVGPFATKGDARNFGVTMRWADAIVKWNNIVYIIEGKMFPEFGGLAQLEEYAVLFKRTPDFQELWSYPVKLVYLTTREDFDVRSAAEVRGIEYVIFRPGWAVMYERQRMRAPPIDFSAAKQ